MKKNSLIKKLTLRKYLQRVSDISYAYNQVNRSNPDDDEAIQFYSDLILQVKSIIKEYENENKERRDSI